MIDEGPWDRRFYQWGEAGLLSGVEQMRINWDRDESLHRWEENMHAPTKGALLRLLIGEGDRYHNKPLYEWLVVKARESGLAGATVIRGMMGFGASSRIHTSKILRLSQDLPVIVEIVDTREKLECYLGEVESALNGGLATIEKADVRFYRAKE